MKNVVIITNETSSLYYQNIITYLEKTDYSILDNIPITSRDLRQCLLKYPSIELIILVDPLPVSFISTHYLTKPTLYFAQSTYSTLTTQKFFLMKNSVRIITDSKFYQLHLKEFFPLKHIDIIYPALDNIYLENHPSHIPKKIDNIRLLIPIDKTNYDNITYLLSCIKHLSLSFHFLLQSKEDSLEVSKWTSRFNFQDFHIIYREEKRLLEYYAKMDIVIAFSLKDIIYSQYVGTPVISTLLISKEYIIYGEYSTESSVNDINNNRVVSLYSNVPNLLNKILNYTPNEHYQQKLLAKSFILGNMNIECQFHSLDFIFNSLLKPSLPRDSKIVFIHLEHDNSVERYCNNYNLTYHKLKNKLESLREKYNIVRSYGKGYDWVYFSQSPQWIYNRDFDLEGLLANIASSHPEIEFISFTQDTSLDNVFIRTSPEALLHFQHLLELEPLLQDEINRDLTKAIPYLPPLTYRKLELGRAISSSILDKNSFECGDFILWKTSITTYLQDLFPYTYADIYISGISHQVLENHQLVICNGYQCQYKSNLYHYKYWNHTLTLFQNNTISQQFQIGKEWELPIYYQPSTTPKGTLLVYPPRHTLEKPEEYEYIINKLEYAIQLNLVLLRGNEMIPFDQENVVSVYLDDFILDFHQPVWLDWRHPIELHQHRICNHHTQATPETYLIRDSCQIPYLYLYNFLNWYNLEKNYPI